MKKNNIVLIIAGLILFLVGNNCVAQMGAKKEKSSVRKQIEENNARYFELYAKNDAAIVDLYTEDGCLMVPNEPSKCGKAALTKDFSDTYAAGKIKGVKFTTIAVYGKDKDFVTEEGSWQVLNRSGKVIDDGKYLKLWKRTKQGWKIFRDLFNSDHSNL